MVSIIIPCYNEREMTEECLRAIIKNTDDFEIVLVDNGSNPPLLPMVDGKYVVNRIRNETNLGFPKAVNQGIDASKGAIVVIMNNDVIVTLNWLKTLKGRLSDGLDMVGPVTNSISGPQQVLIEQYGDCTALYKAAEGHQNKNLGSWYPFHRLVFYCVAIKREVFDKIGLLDEIYTPGNYEDDDYCLRAIDAGFKLGVAQDCYVHHVGSVTHKAIGINYQELATRNRNIFNAKWKDRYDELRRKNNEA